MYMCLAPERGRGFEEYGSSSGLSLKSGKDGWNGGLPPCQVLNEVGERDYQHEVRQNVQAGAVPKYTVASVEGEKGTKTRGRGRQPPAHSDFRRYPPWSGKVELMAPERGHNPVKELAPNEV